MAVTGDDGTAAHVKRMRLATELRMLRDVSGLTGRELAGKIGVSQSKISRVEAGVVLPSVTEVTAWARAVGAAERTQALLDRLTDAARTEAEDWYSTLEVRQSLQENVREREAVVVRTRAFETTLIPGLLQTPDYAQLLLTMFKQTMPQIDVPVAAAERINRQSALYEEGKEYEFIIGEAALRDLPVPPRLAPAQLDRLVTLSTKDNVTLGIVPQGIGGGRVLRPYPFTIYEARGDAGDDTHAFVYLETLHAGVTLRASDDVAVYEREWAALRREARFGDDARTLIKELITEVQALAD